MSFHVAVDRNARTTHDLDDQHPPNCVRAVIGPSTTRMAALRWLGQVLKAVGEGYDPAGEEHELAETTAGGEKRGR